MIRKSSGLSIDLDDVRKLQKEERMQDECQLALEKVFELLAGCLFTEASAACDQQRKKKLELAVAYNHKVESITDLLIRVVRAEEDILKLIEASEPQREQLQETYFSAAKSVQEIITAANRQHNAERKNSLRPVNISQPPAAPSALTAWLMQFSMLMHTRGEMIRVLRALSKHDALADVRQHILDLEKCTISINFPHIASSPSPLSWTRSQDSFSSCSTSLVKSNAVNLSLTRSMSGSSLHRSNSYNCSANTSQPDLGTPAASLSSTPIHSLAHIHSYTAAGATLPAPWPLTGERGSDACPGSPPLSPSCRLLKPFGDRVVDEVCALLNLLQAYESIMSYDLLACTQALHTANACLLRIAAVSRYVSSYSYVSSSSYTCVLILLYMLHTANACLLRIAAVSRRGGSIEGPVTGGKTISEWWTQVDGYWGPGTTRALQQFLNAQRVEEGREVLLFMSSYCCMCAHTVICVLILLYVCS